MRLHIDKIDGVISQWADSTVITKAICHSDFLATGKELDMVHSG